MQTTIDEYIYTPDDTVVEGEVEEGRVYGEEDFNRIIEIKAREEKRVKIILDEIHQKEKSLVFCANQEHAMAIRDLINQHKQSSNPNYCHRGGRKKHPEHSPIAASQFHDRVQTNYRKGNPSV